MLKLVYVDMQEFKNVIYPEYINLFPECERKSYKVLEKTYDKGILKVLKIMDKDEFIGFIITDSLANNKCLLLDYFAILPKYQNRGYGTAALKLLKQNSMEYYGIFIEVDKPGKGKNEEENNLRRRRIEFYERLGCQKLNFELNLYNNIFVPYILQTSSKSQDEDKIIKDVFDIYLAIMGKTILEKNCMIIRAKTY